MARAVLIRGARAALGALCVRLPTEAEWERAARGSPSASFPSPWGDTTVDCDHAIYAGCPPGGPVEATQRRPGDTPQGLHHMAGNVREWVADCYAKDYYTTLVGQSATPSVSNPTGPSCPQGSPHVLRGGGFGSEPDALVVWHRETDGALPDAPADAGVRCAISLMP